MGKTNVKKVKEKKENSNKKFLIIAICIAIVLFVSGYFILSYVKSDDIKTVKKVLDTDYYSVECLDEGCSGIMASSGEKLKKSTITLLNKDGKKVAKYTENYNSKAKTLKEPYQVAKNYFIMKVVNSKDNEISSYTINNKNGKELYSTKNELRVLNDDYVIMNEDKTYTILNSKGKELYSNIKEYESYNDGKIIYLSIDKENMIFDEKLDKLLDDYKVDTEVKDESTIYLILKDTKNGVYNYFDVNKNQIIGDSFENYTSSSNNEMIITKDVNGNKEKYTLDKKGNQIKISDAFVKVEEVSKIESKIDSSKYYLYTTSIYMNDQQYVLVDNKEKKEFGLLNLKNNKFKKIFSYKSDVSNIYSSVSKLDDTTDNIYLQITCSKKNCDKQSMYVYDMKNTNILYSINDETLTAQKYTQYEDNYKVVRYSYSSSNTDYKGKYVLYDKNNKELLKSTNEIFIIDKDIIFGNVSNSTLIIYSAKKNKTINKDSSTATVINVDGKKLYKYNDDDNNTIILNEKGKQVIKVKSGQYLKYSNDSIIYIDNDIVKIYDTDTYKTKKYKLKENEKLNDASGYVIPPYKSAIFINNTNDKYAKVVNSKGNTIKTIKNVTTNKVYQNDENLNVFIIVKKTTKNGNLYGLYLAK